MDRLAARTGFPGWPVRVVPEPLDQRECLAAVVGAPQRRRLRAGPYDVGAGRGIRAQLPDRPDRGVCLGWETHGAAVGFGPRRAEVVGVEHRGPPVLAAGTREQPDGTGAGVDRAGCDLLHEEMWPVELPRSAVVVAVRQPQTLASADHQQHRHSRSVPDPSDIASPRYEDQPVGAGTTTLANGSPAAYRSSWSRTRRRARGRKADVLPPTWGEMSTPGADQSGCPVGSGSGAVTSNAARRRPDRSSATSASVSTTAPRATLTSRAPSRMRARKAASTRPRVGSVSERRSPYAHSDRSWARTNSGMLRSEARTSVTASSAVLASWTPRALHSVIPSRRKGVTCSYPAVRVCTTATRGIRVMTSPVIGSNV